MIEYVLPVYFIILGVLLISSFFEITKQTRKVMIKLRRLKKKLKAKENNMAKLIDELIGKTCKIESHGIVKVISADDEWIKYAYTDKRGIEHVAIERIENIDSIEIISDGQ